MFSPSQLIQSMAQRANVAAPKPIELTAGQVFKGTVIKHYPNQMALVQIGPIQVQAKLEANLEPGQKAWLQVQPSTDLVTLKVLDTPVDGKGKEGATLEGLMRSLGLPQTKESRAIVQALMNANLPVTKETVHAFSGVAQKLGLDHATLQAFMTAMKRNLPLTPDTVASLKAFFSERPLSTMLQNFLQQAARFLETNDHPSSPAAGQSSTGAANASGQGQGQGQPSGPALLQGQTQSQTPQTAQAAVADVRQLVTQLREKLANLPVQVLNLAQEEQQTANAHALGNRGNGINQQQLPSNPQLPSHPQSPGNSPQNQILASHAQADAQHAESAPPLHRPTGQQPLAVISQNSTLQSENRPGQIAALPSSSSAAPIASPPSFGTARTDTPVPSMQHAQPALGNPGMTSVSGTAKQIGAETGNRPVEAQIQAAQTAQTAGRSNPIQQLFLQLGFAHERELMGQALAGATAWDSGVQKQMESVKALLLQLTQSNANMPIALREAADQLLQQVTGQQLMLSQPAHQSLAQIVMQIPLRTEQGDETAYVQIESKKKGAGQLDAENCRLFFHLQLQALGTTMIDVNIVNRIVNLHIYNDTPGIDALAHAIKGGLTDQLQEIGYSLSSMRVQTIPEQQAQSTTVSAAAKASLMSDYKGVDLRI